MPKQCESLCGTQGHLSWSKYGYSYRKQLHYCASFFKPYASELDRVQIKVCAALEMFNMNELLLQWEQINALFFND